MHSSQLSWPRCKGEKYYDGVIAMVLQSTILNSFLFPPLEFSNFFLIIILFSISVLFSCKYRSEFVRVKVKYPINFSISYMGEKKGLKLSYWSFFQVPSQPSLWALLCILPLEILTGNGWKGGSWGECAGSMQWGSRIKTYQAFFLHLPTSLPFLQELLWAAGECYCKKVKVFQNEETYLRAMHWKS